MLELPESLSSPNHRGSTRFISSKASHHYTFHDIIMENIESKKKIPAALYTQQVFA